MLLPTPHRDYGYAQLTPEMLTELANRVKSKKVIDLGCGSGEILHLVSSLGVSSAFGLDIKLPSKPKDKRRVYSLSFSQLPKGDWSDFTAIISWPTTNRQSMQELVEILPNFETLIVIAKTTDGTMCGSPKFWQCLSKWECETYIPYRKNDFLVYNTGQKSKRRHLTLTEYAGVNQDVTEPIMWECATL